VSEIVSRAGAATLSKTQGLKLVTLCLGLAGMFALTVVFPALGHLSIDEAIYNFMARSFATGGDLTIWNGYEEFPSPELVPPTVHVRAGALVPQYPPLFAILAAPLYGLVGYQALILLNAAAFAGVLGLTFLIARRLAGGAEAGLDACLILIFATYAFQYGVTAWPHMTSTFFVLAAVACAIRAHDAADSRSELAFALLAGLIAGLGIGVRLDTAFVVPALVLPFLFRGAPRPIATLAVILGMLPGLLLLAWFNHLKFGVFNPFTYAGAGGAAMLRSYLPLLGLGSVATVLLWLVTRPRIAAGLARHPRWLALGLIAVAAVTASVPTLRDMALRLLDGATQLLFDLRLRDLAIEEPALSRGPTGGMVYRGTLKKSLLQSLPWLVLLSLPVMEFLRGRGEVRVLAVLLLVPATFIGVFSFFAWHGGMAYNLRYFVPILPVCAVLGALAWRRLPRLAGRWQYAGIAAVAAAFAGLSYVIATGPPSIAAQETVFLTVPLAIAGGLALLLFSAHRIDLARAPVSLRGAMAAVALGAFAWAGAVEWLNDLPRAYLVRDQRAKFGERIDPMVKQDALIFSSFAEIAFRLIDRGDVRFAMPRYDDFDSFAALAGHHLQEGHPVYIWIGPTIRDEVETDGLPGGFTVETLYQNDIGRFGRLRRGGP